VAEPQNKSTFDDRFSHNEPTYRAYLLDDGNNIVWAELILAHDGEDAMNFTQRTMENHAIELWDRTRFVARLEVPKTRQAA